MRVCLDILMQQVPRQETQGNFTLAFDMEQVNGINHLLWTNE